MQCHYATWIVKASSFPNYVRVITLLLFACLLFDNVLLYRTLSKKGFTIACKLAKRHHIPDWEVYMELLETLLTTSS